MATTGPDTTPDPQHPKPPRHSDNEKSELPPSRDAGENSSPADKPGKQPGEGEPSVG